MTFLIVVIGVFVVFCAAVWGLVRVVDRHHRKTWGDAKGVEPGVKPVPEGKFWLGQDRG
jgi:uncharacterized membrane protein